MSDVVMVAIVTAIGGGCVGGSFALVQALIKLKFDKKVHDDNRADSKDKRFEDLRAELKEGLDEREKTGKNRFEIHNKMIEENTVAIKELIDLNKQQTTKLDEFATNVTKSFDVMSGGVRSVLYDKITVVYDKCLSRCDGGAITSEEEANIEQLYLSYSGLGGNGEGKTMWKKACGMKTVTKEEAERLDAERRAKFV